MQKQNDTLDIITNFSVESYAVFQNIDRSILATNSFLERFGYQFVCIDLEELEKNFSSLFLTPKELKSQEQEMVRIINGNRLIPKKFFHALRNHASFGNQTIINNEVIFLKAINDFEGIINNTIDCGVAIQQSGKLQEFVTALIQHFRLSKNGDINSLTTFHISKEEREVITKMSNPMTKSYGHLVFTLTASEAENIGHTFGDTFIGNDLTKIAISNFNLSYDIADIKTKYITLMTCLESLFNQGKDQIAHTVSRHLSLIISNSESDFQSNYCKIKKLYNLRSVIIHGGDTTKEDLPKKTEELQNLVRQAINYCLRLQLNKQQLFDKLNAFGFGEL